MLLLLFYWLVWFIFSMSCKKSLCTNKFSPLSAIFFANIYSLFYYSCLLIWFIYLRPDSLQKKNLLTWPLLWVLSVESVQLLDPDRKPPLILPAFCRPVPYGGLGFNDWFMLGYKGPQIWPNVRQHWWAVLASEVLLWSAEARVGFALQFNFSLCPPALPSSS